VAQDLEYTIGRGRPPLHTRFKKGQSGNPSGKPGPAKLLKQRFQRALCAALDGSMEDLERMKPDSAMAEVARRMALDATQGRASAQRLLMSALNDAGAKSEEEPSLAQGKEQGGAELSLEELMGLVDDELTAAGQRPYFAQPSSLVQGKMQGSEQTNGVEDLDAASDDVSKREGEGCEEAAAPVSVVQGKEQGSLKNDAPLKREITPEGSHYNSEPLVANGRASPSPLAARQQLLNSAAAFSAASVIPRN
jgi:hypothetical protein